jgi:putative ABC transport system permease protein
MQAVLRDIRYGARSLRKSRALTTVAVLALTLGIGLTTTMFSIVYGALLKGMPFPDSDQLAFVQRENLSRGNRRMSTPIHDYLDIRAQQRSFSGIAAYHTGTVNVSGVEKAERYDGAWVSSELFDVLQVRPLLGRTFTRAEETPGNGNVAILSHAMWQDRYAGDPSILGKSIRANGAPYTVVGIMPPKFSYPGDQAIWMPMQLDAVKLERGGRRQARARRRPVARAHRASQARHLLRRRERRRRHDREAHRGRVQADERGRDGLGTSDHRGSDRPTASPAALDDAWRRVLRAPDRVRERGEPAARPRGASHEGSRHPDRARRVEVGGR